MRAPTAEPSAWITLPELESTQTTAIDLVRKGTPSPVVFAHHQTQGRGRFDRQWLSQPGDSLTMSLTFVDQANHPAPHLIGMAAAIAVAGALHVRLQWPNDLVSGSRKVGGILTDVVLDPSGRAIPVVGIGVNLNQQSFPPEIEARATSLFLQTGRRSDPLEVAKKVVARFASLPDASHWSELASLWQMFDCTRGKTYVLPSGELAEALGVGSDAQLLCSVNGESASVPVADALFGPQ